MPSAFKEPRDGILDREDGAEMESLAACILCGDAAIGTLDREFNVCRCRVCGLVFENPRPSTRSIIEFYSRPMQYDGWLKESAARDRLWKRRLAKLERHRNPGSLLDIGTGIGQFLSLAKSRFTEVAGTEVSSSAVAIARERYALDILHGEAEDIDFGSRRFDNITLFHVLEHVKHPGRLLAKCRSLLVPGGKLFIAVPNDIRSVGAAKRRLQSRIAPETPRLRGVHGLPRLTLDGSMDEIHLSHFTAPVLAGYLPGAGFAVVESSLDPFYACTGPRLAKMHLIYWVFSLIHGISGANGYGTIWICARKT